MSLTLTSGEVFSHGGTGGTPVSLTLEEGEFWVSARLCQGQHFGDARIFYVLATMNTGRTIEAGKATGDCVTFTAGPWWQIVGFLGESGDEVDQVGFIYALM